MRFRILKNYFAPMCGDWKDRVTPTSHGIFYRYCNFSCPFCNNQFHDNNYYIDYTYDEYIWTVVQLMKSSRYFKFTGGEPTLNPNLRDAIEIVKQLDGFVFLDSNGSNPEKIAELASLGLLDVLGISLKGLSEVSARNVSCVTDKLCWKNVLESIRIGAANPQVRVIVTHVFYNCSEKNELEKFAAILDNYPNVYLKMNNLLFKKHRQESSLEGIDRSRFLELANDFVNEHPKWKSRVIVVNSEDAITQYDQIVFL